MSTGHRVLSSIVLLVFLVGCGKDKGTEGHKPGASASAATTSQAPDFTLTVDELDEATKEERKRVGADSKYTGKLLELSGLVEFPIVDDGNQSPIFTLKSAKLPTGLDTTFSITCVCDDRSLYGALGRDQTVLVRGWYDESGQLKSCRVVEKGPDTRVQVTAEQLAADFTTNREAAVKKYFDRTLVLTGTVTKIKPHGEGLTINCHELKGDGKTVVEVRYNKPAVADQYKVGDTVKITSSMLLSGGAALNLALSYPLPK
jgi:hypothetical protein